MSALVLTTLMFSHYFYAVSAPIIGLLSIIAQAMISMHKIKFRLHYYSTIWLVYFCFLNVTDLALIIFKTGETLLIGRIGLWFMLVALCFAATAWVNYQSVQKLNKIMYRVVMVICFTAILQTVSYLMLGVHVDYVEPITGEHSRNIAPGASFVGASTGFRASGLFTEPGNLGTILSFLYFIYKLTRYNDKKKSDEILLSVSVYLTFVITFSLFSLVWFILHAIHDLRTSKMKFRIKIIVVVLFSLILLPVLSYASFRLSDPVKLASSMGQIYGVMHYINSLGYIDLFFGVSHFVDLRETSKIVLSDGTFILFETLQHGIMRMGILAGLLIYIFIKSKQKFDLLMFIFLMLLSKFNFANYWLIYLLFLYFRMLEKNDSKGIPLH